MDVAYFAGFWLRHQRIGTRFVYNPFSARALYIKSAKGGVTGNGRISEHSPEALSRP
jgi:hypothetical protein